MKTESNEWPSQDVLRKLIEAAEILLHPQPSEDPDEWVILDPVKYTGHVLRKNIDFTNTRTGWEPISIWGGDTIGGVMNDYKGERVLFRCRRRDLPKVEQAEQWPKYYTARDGADSIAFVRRDSATQYTPVMVGGTEIRTQQWGESDNLRDEITEAEAMALLIPKQCAVGCHGPRCPNPALLGKDHCSECAEEPQPQKPVSDETELEKLKRHYEHRGRRLEALTKKVKTLRRALTDYKKAQDAIERERQAEWMIRYAESLPQKPQPQPQKTDAGHDWSYYEKQKPQPKKTMLRLWVDSDCNIHAGLRGDRDLELHYDHETRQFYTEEQQ